eukprot:7391588-Prymnesium_polylepis.1
MDMLTNDVRGSAGHICSRKGHTGSQRAQGLTNLLLLKTVNAPDRRQASKKGAKSKKDAPLASSV